MAPHNHSARIREKTERSPSIQRFDLYSKQDQANLHAVDLRRRGARTTSRVARRDAIMAPDEKPPTPMIGCSMHERSACSACSTAAFSCSFIAFGGPCSPQQRLLTPNRCGPLANTKPMPAEAAKAVQPTAPTGNRQRSDVNTGKGCCVRHHCTPIYKRAQPWCESRSPNP